MDPRQFARKRLDTINTNLDVAETTKDKEIVLKKLTNEFPLLTEYWLQLIEIAGDRKAIWNEALKAGPAVLELWTAYLQSPEGTSFEDAERAKNQVGTYFLSSSIWNTLLERTDPSSGKLLAQIVKEAIRVPIYDYAEFFQRANDIEAEEYDVLATLAETVAEITTKRWEFESKLEVQTFTTDDLPTSEIEAWNAYLDYSESLISAPEAKELNPLRDTIQLYQRCLTVTALYPQFWRRFLEFLQKHDQFDGIEDVYIQALHYHPKNRSLRLMYGKYLESISDDNNQLKAAREQFAKVGADDLVQFDLRHGIDPHVDDTSYLIAHNKLTGKPISVEMIAQAPNLFHETNDARVLMEAWEKGLCEDPEAFANRLKHAGRLEEFFKVDATLS